MKIFSLILYLIGASTIYATTYNTPTIDGPITQSASDWDSDENMGLRVGTGGEDWYHYTAWDANYLYIGFAGFNWPNNSNNHLVGHYDFLSGGTQVGINGEALGMTVDFAYQLTRVGSSGVVTFHIYNRTSNIWEETTIPWPSTEIQYDAVNKDTEFRISWTTLTQGESTGPTPFVYYAAVENNSNTVTQIWPSQTNFECGLFEAGPQFEGVAPNTDMTVVCNPPDQSLPVELTAFTVENTLEGVLCKWITESEIDNLGFLVEKKNGGTDWSEIASYKGNNNLIGQGTTIAPTSYEYLDRLVQPNTTYEYRLADVDFNGTVTYHPRKTINVEIAPLSSQLEKFTILQAYPNPFNPSTTITYSLDVDSKVIISIYDLLSNQVTTLLNTKQVQGWYNVEWNGKDNNDQTVPAGMYICNISTNRSSKNIKLMFLK